MDSPSPLNKAKTSDNFTNLNKNENLFDHQKDDRNFSRNYSNLNRANLDRLDQNDEFSCIDRNFDDKSSIKSNASLCDTDFDFLNQSLNDTGDSPMLNHMGNGIREKKFDSDLLGNRKNSITTHNDVNNNNANNNNNVNQDGANFSTQSIFYNNLNLNKTTDASEKSSNNCYDDVSIDSFQNNCFDDDPLTGRCFNHLYKNLIEIKPLFSIFIWKYCSYVQASQFPK